MKLDYSRGASPLYYQLKDLIKEKIINNEYKTGEMIESEKELQTKYNLSRITVRQALNELVNEGYLLRQRGKGTTVLGQNLFEERLVKVKSFTDEMREIGYVPGTLSTDVSLIKESKLLEEKSQIFEAKEVYKVSRVRTANDIPIVVFETYLPQITLFKEQSLKQMESLYDLFAQFQIKIQRVEECFEVSLATKSLAEKLNVQESFPLMQRTRQSYSPQGELIEYTIAYYNSKLYKFHLEMEGK